MHLLQIDILDGQIPFYATKRVASSLLVNRVLRANALNTEMAYDAPLRVAPMGLEVSKLADAVLTVFPRPKNQKRIQVTQHSSTQALNHLIKWRVVI